MTNGRFPVLFLQPANAVSFGPTFNLVKVTRKDDRAHIYPPITIKDDDDDVHTRFIKSHDQVFDGWGEDAIEFLARLKIAYEAPAKKKCRRLGRRIAARGTP